MADDVSARRQFTSWTRLLVTKVQAPAMRPRIEPNSSSECYEFKLFVIACTIGHLEQGIACVEHARAAKNNGRKW